MLSKLIESAISRQIPLRSSDEIRAEVKERHNRIGDDQARRYVRGNVNIKQGAYIFETTRKDDASR